MVGVLAERLAPQVPAAKCHKPKIRMSHRIKLAILMLQLHSQHGHGVRAQGTTMTRAMIGQPVVSHGKTIQHGRGASGLGVTLTGTMTGTATGVKILGVGLTVTTTTKKIMGHGTVKILGVGLIVRTTTKTIIGNGTPTEHLNLTAADSCSQPGHR